MKSPKLILNEVKRILGQEVKLEQMTLDNGTVIEAEVLEAGSPVFIVSEDENIPLPVGDYTLEDGRMLVVTEDGIIAEVKDSTAEVVEEEMEADKPAYVTQADFDAAINDIKSMLSSIDKPEPKKEEVKASKVEKVEEKKVELSEEAAAKPIKANPDRETKKGEVVNLTKNAPRTKFDAMVNVLNNLNLS